ncbi:hypothetical protein [Taibaiella chishuiensis]|uniref:Sporulation related protein n=1 Tax=Taibaiella chishuiensis TaxID=1434707 RepID=A0A2P8CWE7_9BACT|nr:hypothetical protein [Taibaiella chishuiensis]PSK89298.1 hypothetical protein B0I18_11299 [Taibaiella chishuiensis]
MNHFHKNHAYVFLLLCLCITSSCGGDRCPDGEVVYRDKSSIDNYKGFTKTFEASIKGTVEVIDKVKLADLDAGLQNQVTKLRDDLDQYSGRSSNLLMTSLIRSNMYPCDKELRQKTTALIEQMQLQSSEIERLRYSVSAVTQEKNEAAKDTAIQNALIDFKGVQEEITDKLQNNTLNTLQTTDEWVVVCSGDKILEDSQFEKNKIEKQGFSNNMILLRNGSYRLITSAFSTKGDATEALYKLRNAYKNDVYIVNLKTWCPNKISRSGYYECN